MPSQLSNLIYRVRWSDFQGSVPQNTTHSALIRTRANLRYGFTSSGGVFRLQDTVTVTITLDRAQSWAKPGAARTAYLLNHEQRHYDITALMARDMFIALMQLKTRSFSSQRELERSIQDISARYNPQPVHDRYDPETDHSLKQAEQRRWDCMIDRAFNQPRSPAMRAPDGTPYKLELLDVIGGNARVCIPAAATP